MVGGLRQNTLIAPTLIPIPSGVRYVAIGGTVLAAVSVTGGLFIIENLEEALVPKPTPFTSGVGCVSVSPDGAYVAAIVVSKLVLFSQAPEKLAVRQSSLPSSEIALDSSFSVAYLYASELFVLMLLDDGEILCIGDNTDKVFPVQFISNLRRLLYLMLPQF